MNSEQSQGETAETKVPFKPGWVRVSVGRFTLQLEPRYFLITILILPLYLLAAFVGNDWAYMLPSALLATLAIGFFLPLLELVSIACSCSIPALGASLGERDLILRAWRLPSFGALSSLIPSGYLKAQLHLVRRNWGGKVRTKEIVPLPVVLESLGRGLEIKIRLPALGRGVYDAESIEISSCFPFSIFWWSRRIGLNSDQQDARITVLPALREMAGNFHSRLSCQVFNSAKNMQAWSYQRLSNNLKGLREFTERDSLNQIHWATSARTGKLLVREFEAESLPDFDVMLDLNDDWSDSQFELACTAAYSLIHYGQRMGFSPRLRLNPSVAWGPLAEEMADIPSGVSGEDLAGEMLARVAPLPAELLQKLKNEKKSGSSTAIDYVAELSTNARALICVVPCRQDSAAGSIAFKEVLAFEEGSNSVDAAEDAMHTEAPIAQIENDAELARL